MATKEIYGSYSGPASEYYKGGKLAAADLLLQLKKIPAPFTVVEIHGPYTLLGSGFRWQAKAIVEIQEET